jgi:hypothetical protein
MPVVRSLLLLSADKPMDAADANAPREAVLAALAEANIRYLVLDRAQASPALAAYVASLPLRSIAREPERELFVVESR